MRLFHLIAWAPVLAALSLTAPIAEADVVADGRSKVVFRFLRVEQTPQGFPVVRGQMGRLFPRSSIPFGHLDYSLHDSKGKAVETGSAVVKAPGSFSHFHVHSAAPFSFPLKRRLPPGWQIRLTWHERSHPAE